MPKKSIGKKQPTTRWRKKILKVTLTILAASFLLTVVAIKTADGRFQCFDSVGDDQLVNTFKLSAEKKSQIDQATKDIERYHRPEESTYLTFPEWYIVYSTQEYAAFIANQRPSQFPYFQATKQYWESYRCMVAHTKGRYPFNQEVYLMLRVIGASFSAENTMKAFHEGSFGAFTELVSGNEKTAEDIFAAKVADKYGQFLNLIPWYKFPFGQTLFQFWRETPPIGPHSVRKWERRLFHSSEYALKAGYGKLIDKALAVGGTPAPEEITVVTTVVPEAVLARETQVKVIATLSENMQLLSLPRYLLFTQVLPELSAAGVDVIEVAGNDEIMLTVLAPEQWQPNLPDTLPVFEMSILSDSSKKRVGLRVPVATLSATITSLADQDLVLEHLYDY